MPQTIPLPQAEPRANVPILNIYVDITVIRSGVIHTLTKRGLERLRKDSSPMIFQICPPQHRMGGTTHKRHDHR